MSVAGALSTQVEPAKSKKVVLFIECGTTMSTSVNTGIQRVVRSIILQSPNVCAELGLGFSPVAFVGKEFVEIDRQGQAAARPKVLRLLARMARQVLPKRIYSGLILRAKSGLVRLRSNNLSARSIKQILRAQEKSLNGQTCLPILLLLDSTWDNGIWESVEEFRSNGGIVCAVLYDLIPFTHPNTVAEMTRMQHTGWWKDAPLHVDAVMCISRSVKDEFISWQKEQELERVIEERNIGHFYLGADLTRDDPIIRILSSQTPMYLVVGSLEPRKNHGVVLDAFEKLWSEGAEINLVIVGAFGWKSEKLLDRINGHPELGAKLFLVRDASDRDLTALYNKCQALIFASLAEGFGLPIVEARQLGASVICSDIPVFREVAAGQMATFFNPLEPESLVSAIRNQANKLNHLQVLEKGRLDWITWHQSTRQLLERVKEIALQK